MSDEETGTAQHIRSRIEQIMGKDWMYAQESGGGFTRRRMFTVDLFDEFLHEVSARPMPSELPTWNFNGSRLTIPGLSIIAEAIEVNGGVIVKGVEVRHDVPTVKALGFQIIHRAEPGQFFTEAIPINPEPPKGQAA